MPTNDIYILVPYSLDGVGAFLASRWYLNEEKYNVKILPTNKERFCSDYQSLLPLNPSRIYVIGGYIVDNCEEKLDNDKVVIFKLEKENVTLKDVKIVSADSDSYTSLMSKIFKDKYKINLNSNKTLLLTLIQDYVTYKLKYDKISIGLNYIFQNLNNIGENKLEKFCKKYENGFENFTEEDKKVISYYNEKLKKSLGGDRYQGTLPTTTKSYKIVSCFATSCINEVAAALIRENDSDIAIIVNPDTNLVTFRRKNDCTVNLKKLAQKLCDGDGKEYAASGKITENFLLFTQTLQKI
jgi:hypothetical protein